MSNKLPDSYISEETIQSLQESFNASGDDYKCIVCVFLFGAADAHNMLVPYGPTNPNRALYNVARARAVRLENIELESTLLSGGPGTSPKDIPGAPAYEWALHPSLEGMHQEWNNSSLAIVRHVGVLNRPTTKFEYINNPDGLYVPDSLFSHNSQVLTWQAALPFKALQTTGWFGRTSSLIDRVFNAQARVDSGTISVAGASPQTFAYSPKTTVVFPGFTISPGDNRGSSNDLFVRARDNFYHRNSPLGSPIGYPPEPVNNIYNAFSRIFRNSVTSQEDVNVNGQGWDPNDGGIGTQLEQIFIDAVEVLSEETVIVPDPLSPNETYTLQVPAQGFIFSMKNIAKIIYSRGDSNGIGFKQMRQMIYSGLGGWDHHNSLRYHHDTRTRTLDICLKALIDALKLMGVYDKVTIFTESDFGRTFRSNGTYGVDHAWATHCFVMGGAVQGGLYGPEPDYTLGGPKDVSTLGRFIPEFSLEQYYGTLLKWFDVPEELIPLILPAIDLFDPKDIGFMG